MRALSTPTSAALAIVWTGLLAFGASLVFFVYSFVVRCSEAPAPGSAAVPALVNVVLFSIFALHHTLFARTPLKAWVRRTVPPYLERSLYTWVASVLFLLVCWWWQPVPGVLYRLPPPLSWIGVGAQAAGGLLMLLSSGAIDMLDLAGVRPVLSAQSGIHPGHVPLETSGFYGFVRHPVYFGWTLFVFDAPDMTATRAVFAVVSCAYLALAVPFEERSLIDTFGTDYEEYRTKVRWRMVPGLY